MFHHQSHLEDSIRILCFLSESLSVMSFGKALSTQTISPFPSHHSPWCLENWLYGGVRNIFKSLQHSWSARCVDIMWTVKVVVKHFCFRRCWHLYLCILLNDKNFQMQLLAPCLTPNLLQAICNQVSHLYPLLLVLTTIHLQLLLLMDSLAHNCPL